MATLALVIVSTAGLLINSYRSYAKIVDARFAHGYLSSGAGIYAAPRTLRAGQKYSPAGLADILQRAGYVEDDAASDVWNGSFSVNGASIEVRTNNLAASPAGVLITFTADGRIDHITADDLELDSFRLAPESLTNDSTMRGAARAQLSFKEIPPVLVQAITSIEDRRFFNHPGLDVFGIARALLRNAGSERIGQGGSTITQQLIKNTYLTPERTLRRKYAEAMLAFTLEQRLSKQDIFALYCNEIFLGQRGAVAVRGVDQAARVYFGKQLDELTLAEAATIAGMIQSPSHYSPLQQNDATRERRNTVLGTMVRDGFITLDQAAAAAKEPLTVAEFDPARESVAPYFIDYVNRVMERRHATGGARASSLQTDGDSTGSDAGEPPASIPAVTDGAPMITTLDLDLQSFAANAIKHQLDRLDEIYRPRGLTPQAALVALDPKTGNVLAMIGGRNYAASQLNRATDAARQPGSVFKPFVYATALDGGMSPLQLFRDAPQEFTYARTQKYRPSNYGGAFSGRDVPMRVGLIKSLNVVTVDVAMQTGLARIANTAQRFGLPRPKPFPALALGTTEVTPLQIAAAYATFANGGNKIKPRAVADEVIPDPEQVIAPTTAYMITDMLEGVIDQGTARAARSSFTNIAIAGKTGTSRDGWFVGYTANLVCAVWVGFDDNNQLGLTGAEAALPLWTDFMKTAIDSRPELGGKAFDQPDGITLADIDPETQQLATGKCPAHERIAMLTVQAPTSECFRHNIYFDLRDDTEAVNTSSLAKIKKPQSLRRLANPSSKELPMRNTGWETDKVGRRVLTNEMKVAAR